MYGGGGELGSGGAGAFGRGGRSEDSSVKDTHMSLASMSAGGASSGPKRLSKLSIEGFLVEPFASDDTSGTKTSTNQSKAVFAEVLSKFTHGDKTSETEITARKTDVRDRKLEIKWLL